MRIPTTFNKMGLSPNGGGGIPTSGLTFYAPLASKENYAQTGQLLNYTNILSSDFTSTDGIPCFYKTSSGKYIFSSIPAMSGKNEITFSIWCKFINKNSYQTTIAIGQYSPSSKWVGIGATSSGAKLDVFSYFEDISIQSDYSINTWYNLCITYDGQTVKFYMNGTLVGYQNTSAIFFNENTQVDLFTNANQLGRYEPRGYFAASRVYDRVLTQEEIATLASEFTVQYEIIAQDLSFSLYQKNETYGISYSSPITPVTFEIIEGSLPNTISFNTSTGQFSGKGLTDANHTYNLKVRLTAPNSIPATCNVTIHTYMTARISLNNQTFNFISNKAENFAISYTSDEAVTFTIESGTMPVGMTLSNGRFYSSGTNTSADIQQVVIRATSAHNQTGVARTMTLNMQMNAVVLNAQTFKFYTSEGVKTKNVKYSGSLNSVNDAVFSMSGTLPIGITWDATSGAFTSDGTQVSDVSGTVDVEVSSSSGTSTSAIATMTIEAHVGEPPDYGLVFYAPLASKEDYAQTGQSLTYSNVSASDFVTQDGINCFNKGTSNRQYIMTSIGSLVGDVPFTISIWCKFKSKKDWGAVCVIGANGSLQTGISCGAGGANLGIYATNDRQAFDTGYYLNTWYHLCYTYDGSTGRLFLDGVESTTLAMSNTFTADNFCIGNTIAIGNYTADCYYAAARVYNRVLTQDEIDTLASEFTPAS